MVLQPTLSTRLAIKGVMMMPHHLDLVTIIVGTVRADCQLANLLVAPQVYAPCRADTVGGANRPRSRAGVNI